MAIALFSPIACKKAVDVRPQWYRAAIHAPDGAAIFFLKLPPPGVAGPATIANGQERISADHRWSGDRSWLWFDLFDSTIESTLEPNQTLKGQWTVSHQNIRVPFSAEPIPELDQRLRYGVKGTLGPQVNVTGSWNIQVEGSEGRVKGVFEQEANTGVVTGTFIREHDEDARYLAGNVVGRELMLSTFDGERTVVFLGHVTVDGGMDGKLIEHGFVTRYLLVHGVRSDDFDIEIGTPIELAPGKKELSIPELKRPPYVGKPVIIDMFGTWCPTCSDAVPLLKDLYARHSNRGLQVMGLAFEMSADTEYCTHQIKLFRRRYDPPWEIIARPGTPEHMSELLPPELTNVEGLPLTAFINRDGTVRTVVQGFVGPAAGRDYERQRKIFEQLADEIVRSTAHAAGP